MNERIKELAKQCWEERPEGQLHFDNEKFAEMIVRECAELMDRHPDHPYNPRGKIIKHHFGVE
jgi:hypothetical protein